MRAVLGALLFQQPDLLLLDEPTNHLDLPSVAWFSDFLKRYKRAFVLISHDRDSPRITKPCARSGDTAIGAQRHETSR